MPSEEIDENDREIIEDKKYLEEENKSHEKKVDEELEDELKNDEIDEAEEGFVEGYEHYKNKKE